MSDQLDWTQKLGDAFLAQQADVFAAVQALRGRAQSAGKLESNEQQRVTQQGSSIVIAPTQAETVYVPAYNPSVVYGSWPYPSYPPAYYPPPVGYYAGTALATGLAFGAGIALTGALWGWGSPNWSGGNVNINANRFNQINSNRSNNFAANRGAVTSGTWQHNADHRRGVGYTNAQVRQQYRPNSAGNTATRDAFRGRTPGQAGLGQGGVGQAGLGQGGGRGQGGLGQGGLGQAGQRPGGGGAAGRPGNVQRPNAGGGLSAQNRPQNVQRPGGAGGAGRAQGGQRAGGGGAPAFRGVGNGGATRAQSAQGAASRGGGARAGGGGGARAGGGGARAGGGGGARAGGGGGGRGGGGGGRR
jgi:hypothetical protein